MDAYQITDLKFSYPLAKRPALHIPELQISAGEMVVLCGKSGCGKTTLLRHLKPVLTPHGTRSGEIVFFGKSLAAEELRNQASQIGFVQQNPDNQIVTDKVWHELAFGLESLGLDSRTIRLRVAEMASFFGIQSWFSQDVTRLSGGQRQLLSLASVMAMQPSVLILDEPTGQLDPIAASSFLETVRKINQELGTTVILSEQRLEEVFPMADRALVMDGGEIIANGTPQEAGAILGRMQHPMALALPSPMQIHTGVRNSLPCPVTVREGRKWMEDMQLGQVDAFLFEKPLDSCAPDIKLQAEPSLIELRDVWYRYEKSLPDALSDLSMKIWKGQLTCITGGNGSGKTTVLSAIAGLLRPYRGRVLIGGQDLYKMSSGERRGLGLCMLPQNPQTLFVKSTVEQDLYEVLDDADLSSELKAERVRSISKLAELDGLLHMHPYDLSGGEQQRAALAKVLLLEPKILLLDEPTKGLDGQFKLQLASILKELTSRGVTILMVSHDIEFCARHGDFCYLLFNGNMISGNTPRAFFSGNSFYTTAANRMARHIFPDAVTIEDVIDRATGALGQT